MSQTTATPFTPYAPHRAMTADDARVFERAAEYLDWPYITKSIINVGGDRAHMAHFSREMCRGRPVDAWAREQDHDAVATALLHVAAQVKKVVATATEE